MADITTRLDALDAHSPPDQVIETAEDARKEIRLLRTALHQSTSLLVSWVEAGSSDFREYVALVDCTKAQVVANHGHLPKKGDRHG